MGKHERLRADSKQYAKSNLPTTTAVFCCMRLVRPVLFLACFPSGPHTEDTIAQLGIACAWLFAIAGFLGAATLHASPWCKDEEPQREAGLLRSGAAQPRARLVGWCLLALAIIVEFVHQTCALVRWSFFWGTGFLGGGALRTWKEPAAYVLALLHASGFFGVLLLGAICVAHVRWLRLSVVRQRFTQAGYTAKENVVGPKVCDANARRSDTGLREAAADRAEKGQPNVSEPQPSERAAAPGRVMAAPRPAASVEAGKFAERGRPVAAAAAPQRGPQPPRVEAPLGHNAAAARNRSKGPSHVPAGPRSPSPRTVGASNQCQPQSVRAWFWNGDGWVAARVLRTNGDGSATVRLSGGSILRTRQSELQPRPAAGSKEPVPPPPPAAKEQRAQAEPFHQGKRPSATEAEADAKASASPEPQPTDPCTMASKECGDNEDARWAAERIERLRSELHGLDRCSLSERRAHLRRLQLELHPDKQPPERREHAQPLFHLVQREWERWEEADVAARVLAGG